jgi:hypothetical protein
MLSILLSSCNKPLPKKEENPKFVRTWYDTVQGMPLREKLTIKANKTFEYSSRSCESGSESKGTWKIENDTIILKSIKPKGCRFQNRFAFCIPLNDKSYFENNKTIKGCEPNGRDASYAIFENEKFFLKNDSLIYVGNKENPCSNLKIGFSMKEKIRRSVNK